MTPSARASPPIGRSGGPIGREPIGQGPDQGSWTRRSSTTPHPTSAPAALQVGHSVEQRGPQRGLHRGVGGQHRQRCLRDRSDDAPRTGNAPRSRVRRWERPTSLRSPTSTSPGPVAAKQARRPSCRSVTAPWCTRAATPNLAASAFAHASPTHHDEASTSSTHNGSSAGSTRSTQTCSPGRSSTAPPPERRRASWTCGRLQRGGVDHRGVLRAAQHERGHRGVHHHQRSIGWHLQVMQRLGGAGVVLHPPRTTAESDVGPTAASYGR